MNRCVIIGASPQTNTEFIRSMILKDDFVICADGGLDSVLKADIIPDILIGDFDSMPKERLKQCENIRTVVLPVEKDDTDTVSCVRYGMEQGYRNFVLLGVTGGRLDHTYANLHLLKYLAKRNCQGMIMDENTQIFYTENHFVLENKKGKTVSVLPFGCESATVSLSGVKYQAENLVMYSDFPIGISNIVISDNSKVMVQQGGVLIIINREV